jgi:hypothetical protein
VAAVSGTGPTYTVTVTGMSGTGKVVASIPAGAAKSVSLGLNSTASTSTDNSVSFDNTPPTVVLSTSASDPTNAAIPVTAVFSEVVTGFDPTDLVTVNGTIDNFFGSGKVYTFDLTPIAQGLSSVYLPAGTVTDLAGNALALDSKTISSHYDSIPPTVTINQAAGQPDPATVAGPILFTVVFSEPVTGFDQADVKLSGTAGPTTAAVSGSGTTYTVSVTGMTVAGTVVATVRANAAGDDAGNLNPASTSTDNTVTYDPPFPKVTVEQATGQADPTNQSPVLFTVTFDQPVTGFDPTDITLGGTAKPTTAVISGSGPVYTVAVSGMSAVGTVTASIPAGKVTGTNNGLLNKPSTSKDNTVSFDNVPPGITISDSAPLLTNLSAIPVTVTFTEAVMGFTASDLVLVNATAANFSGSGTSYMFNLVASGQGTISVQVPQGAAADSAGNPNPASKTITHQFDNIAPVPMIVLGAGIPNPTNANSILFNVTFSEPVTGFDKSDILLGGTAKPSTVAVAGSGKDYTVTVSGMSNPGTVTAAVKAGAAADPTGNTSPAAGPASVGFDNVAPTLTVDLAAGQSAKANSNPVKFLLTFSEPVTAPSASALSTSLSTVNPGLVLAVNPLNSSMYEVVVANVHGTGKVVLTVPDKLSSDPAGNVAGVPTVIANTVLFDDVPPTVTVVPAAGQTNPTTANPMKYTVTFSEAVTGFDASDVTVSGTAKPTSVNVTGSGATYTIEVGGMSRRGTVTVATAAGAVSDTFGNPVAAATAPVQTYSPTAGGVPVGSEVHLTAVGAGPGGGPAVQVYNADGTPRFAFYAYDQSFTGGVRVAVGDANGDGTDDIITAAGPGGGPHVKVFDGVTGKELWGFYAYDPSFTGGVFVATADFNGDGIIEIITAAGAGGGPHVKVIDMFTGTVRRSFFAYDPNFRGGVNVAAADVTGDDVPDIITGPGPGAGAGVEVRVFDGTNAKQVGAFAAGLGTVDSGLTVAAGDFLGDSKGEIAVASASAINGVNSNQVLIYDITGTLQKAVTVPPGFESANGLRVSAGLPQPNSTHLTLLIAPGPGVTAKLRRFGEPSLTFLDEVQPFPTNFLGGVYVA